MTRTIRDWIYLPANTSFKNTVFLILALTIIFYLDFVLYFIDDYFLKSVRHHKQNTL